MDLKAVQQLLCCDYVKLFKFEQVLSCIFSNYLLPTLTLLLCVKRIRYLVIVYYDLTLGKSCSFKKYALYTWDWNLQFISDMYWLRKLSNKKYCRKASSELNFRYFPNSKNYLVKWIFGYWKNEYYQCEGRQIIVY